jgi:hypothetical protein
MHTSKSSTSRSHRNIQSFLYACCLLLIGKGKIGLFPIQPGKGIRYTTRDEGCLENLELKVKVALISSIPNLPMLLRKSNLYFEGYKQTDRR